MHRTWLLLASVAVATGTVSPAAKTTTAPPRSACFYASQVSGFTDAGPDRAVVRAGFRDAWELTLTNGCPNVDYALNIGIRSRGGERICPGRPAELLIPEASGSGYRRCLVRSIRKLTPAEAAASRGEKP